MIDKPRMRPTEISNCIHAVSDLSIAVQELGMTFTGTLRGISASRFVYQYFWPYFLTHPAIPESEERRFESAQRDSLQVAASAPVPRPVGAMKAAKRGRKK